MLHIISVLEVKIGDHITLYHELHDLGIWG